MKFTPLLLAGLAAASAHHMHQRRYNTVDVTSTSYVTAAGNCHAKYIAPTPVGNASSQKHDTPKAPVQKPEQKAPEQKVPESHPKIAVPAPYQPPAAEKPKSSDPAPTSKPASGGIDFPVSKVTVYDVPGPGYEGACAGVKYGPDSIAFAASTNNWGSWGKHCGKSFEVTIDGKTVVVQLVDKCDACTDSHIDFTRGCWSQFRDRNLDDVINGNMDLKLIG